MIFGISDNRDATAIPKDRCPLGNGVNRVVGPLAVHVGSKEFEKLGNGRFVKYGDVVDAAKRCHQFSAFGSFQNRSARPFRGRGLIVVHGNDQPVGFQRGGVKIPDVTHMQEIETAVGKREWSDPSVDRRRRAR